MNPDATAVRDAQNARTAHDTGTIVTLPAWLARAHNLASRELVGEIVRTTQRGILFSGTVSIRESTHCLRCGRELENGVSQVTGYGPICSDQLGIPRDATADQVADLRARLARDSHLEVWLPRAKVTITDDGQLPAPPDADQPTVATKPPVRVEVSNGTLILHSHYVHKDLCKKVNGYRWSAARKVWTYPATPAVAADLASVFAAADVTVEHGPDFADLLGAAENAQHATQFKDADDLPDVPGTHPDKPAWLHQRQAFWFAKDLTAAGLWMDMGTGKSRVTVELLRTNNARATLIVCPNSVQDVWPREFRRWGEPAGWNPMVFKFKDGKGTIADKTRTAAQQAKLAAASNRPFVCVINLEAAWRDNFMKWALNLRWDYVVVDESHRIKSPGAKVSKAMARLGKQAGRRLALSGTPMANSPLDLYGQYRFLDPGIFGTNFSRFRARYAIMGGYGGYEVQGYQREDELNAKFHSIGYVVGAEVLDLPGILDETIPVRLGNRGAKLYKDLTQQMVAEHDGSIFTAANVLTRILRQQQITGGSVNDDDGNNVVVDEAKAKALHELLEDMPADEKVVVFCRFTHDLRVVRAAAKATHRAYGELSGASRDGLNDEAEMHPDVNVIGVQIQAGGVGIDLTAARYGVYYSLGHSLTDYLQSRKRIHRPGQERHTTLYHLVAEGTVDEAVYAALEAKEEIVEFMTNLHKLDVEARAEAGLSDDAIKAAEATLLGLEEAS